MWFTEPNPSHAQKELSMKKWLVIQRGRVGKTFSSKGQIVNISGYGVDYRVLMATIQLYHHSLTVAIEDTQ